MYPSRPIPASLQARTNMSHHQPNSPEMCLSGCLILAKGVVYDLHALFMSTVRDRMTSNEQRRFGDPEEAPR